jgi:branched-chain amino acid transport system substrate-binding protein
MRGKAITKIHAILIAVILVVVAVAGGLYYYYHTTIPAKKEIVFGCTQPLSGVMARVGTWNLRGYELAIEKINNEGGILGKPVRLVCYDDEFKEDKVKALYEKLCTVDNVDVLLGCWGSGLHFAAGPIAEKYNKILISGGITAKLCFSQGWKNVFGVMTSPYFACQYQVFFYKMVSEDWEKWAPPGAPKPKTMVILAYNNVYGKECVEEGIPILEQLGIKVLWYELYDPKTTDFLPILLRIKADKPDIINSIGYYSDSLMIARQIIEQKVYAPIIYIGEGPNDPEWVDPQKGLGPLGNYMFCYIAWPTTWHKGDADYLRVQYRVKYGEDCPYQTAWHYGVIETLKQAIEVAGSLDTDAIRNALLTKEFVNCFTDVKFNPAGYNERMRIYVGQVINGKIETVWPPEFATASPVYPYPPY